MSSVQKKITKTTKTVTTKKTEQVQSSSVDQSADVQGAIAQKANTLSIVKKGQFFNDSYFEDTRQDFQDAVQDVLTKWGDKSKPTNDINSYRDLRARDLRDENQAIKSSQDQRYHKVNNPTQCALLLHRLPALPTEKVTYVNCTMIIFPFHPLLDRGGRSGLHQWRGREREDP